MSKTYIVVFVIVVIIIIATNIVRAKQKNQITRTINYSAIADTIKTSPVPFGYKCVWFAVKSNSHSDVVEALSFKDKAVTNWEIGIREAYNNSVFVTPPIDGWVLIVGWGLPSGDSTQSIDEIKHLANKLSTQFGEAQFFGTHRIVDYHAWSKSVNGNIIRYYSYIGESGENIEITGAETELEKNTIW